MGWTHRILAAALLCAAGCQHDPALRAGTNGIYLNSYAQEADGLLIVSDTRRVSLDFASAPLDDDIKRDMVFAYLSLPLHPIRGIEFDNPSIGVGWLNAAMEFTNVFAPFSPPTGHQNRITIEDGEYLIEGPLRPGTGTGDELGPVDKRHAEYAAALRADLYKADATTPWNEVLAQAGDEPIGPRSTDD